MLIKRFRLSTAKDRNGKPMAFYYTQPDKSVIHFTVGQGADQIDIYLSAAELLRAMFEVKTGKPYVRGRHAQKDDNGKAENS